MILYEAFFDFASKSGLRDSGSFLDREVIYEISSFDRNERGCKVIGCLKKICSKKSRLFSLKLRNSSLR
jgi:hypothetical protein